MRPLLLLAALLALAGCAGSDALRHPLATSEDIRPDLQAMGYVLEAAPVREVDGQALREARVAGFVAVSPVYEPPHFAVEPECQLIGDVMHCEPTPSTPPAPEPFRTHVEVYDFASPATAEAALPQLRRLPGVGDVYRRGALVVTMSGGDATVARYLREAVGPRV